MSHREFEKRQLIYAPGDSNDVPVKVEDQTTGFRFVGDYKDDLIIDVEKSEPLPETIQEEKNEAARSTPGCK